MTKNIENAILFWRNCARDNMDTARAMYKSGRWSFCMFMCQQTIEAILKAGYIHLKKEPPPYIHNLVLLVNQIGLKLPRDIDAAIILANAHYIKARYKEDRFNPKIYNRKSAHQLLKETEETIKWFIKNLNLIK